MHSRNLGMVERGVTIIRAYGYQYYHDSYKYGPETYGHIGVIHDVPATKPVCFVRKDVVHNLGIGERQ